jgi:hypothetical protein
MLLALSQNAHTAGRNVMAVSETPDVTISEVQKHSVFAVFSHRQG